MHACNQGCTHYLFLTFQSVESIATVFAFLGAARKCDCRGADRAPCDLIGGKESVALVFMKGISIYLAPDVRMP